MGLLTWIGFIIAIIDIFPFYKIIEPLINILRNKSIDAISDNKLYVIFFISLMLLLLIVLTLRKITKNETRHPLFFNYAINGFGNKITLEKVRVGECPICGGEMKYFNKPLEWIDIVKSDGKIKREVTKRVPALQCKRNEEHWFGVDPAEDKVNNKIC